MFRTTQGLLQYFLQNQQTPEISTVITNEVFWNRIKKWKEKTRTSLSGRHLGHYHAQILLPMLDEPKDICTSFLYIHTRILNLAIQHQVVLNQWEKVDSLCIPKDPGVPKVHRLWPLNLYKADLNLVLRHLISRKLTWNAEDHQLLPEDDWGGQQLHSSGDMGLQCVLTL